MAMGRASGDHRVERAIIDALDSPLLYGNDIGRAKRILFNIYGSESCPIIINEMQDIDDFFDQLDPNIEVIWGTSTDESLGEDAKVTILATGMDSINTDGMDDSKRKDASQEKDDEYFESLIPLLYKSRKKDKKPEPEPVEPAETPSQESETPTEPTTAPPPVPQKEETEEPETIERQNPPQPTILDKWKSWLGKRAGELGKRAEDFLQEDE